MLLEAIGLALLASLSPTALLVSAVYLGSDRPKLISALYLAGALIMSLVMGVVILLILRNAGLSHSDQRSPRYGVRLGLGILLVGAGIVVAKRRPAAASENDARPGLVSRMTARPAPLTAFVAGLLIFAPGATFLAAIQVIATAQASIELTAVAVIIVVVMNVTLVWLPIVFYLAAPEMTSRYLSSFNGWLRAHGKAVLTCVLLAAGAFLVANGIYGLTVS